MANLSCFQIPDDSYGLPELGLGTEAYKRHLRPLLAGWRIIKLRCHGFQRIDVPLSITEFGGLSRRRNVYRYGIQADISDSGIQAKVTLINPIAVSDAKGGGASRENKRATCHSAMIPISTITAIGRFSPRSFWAWRRFTARRTTPSSSFSCLRAFVCAAFFFILP